MNTFYFCWHRAGARLDQVDDREQNLVHSYLQFSLEVQNVSLGNWREYEQNPFSFSHQFKVGMVDQDEEV